MMIRYSTNAIAAKRSVGGTSVATEHKRIPHAPSWVTVATCDETSLSSVSCSSRVIRTRKRRPMRHPIRSPAESPSPSMPSLMVIRYVSR